LRRGKGTLARIIVAIALLTLAVPLVTREAGARPDTTLSIINPGPGSWSGSWTAETPNASDIGTTNFTFHSTQTVVGNTFFVNITVTDVERLIGWGIGIVYDNTTLAYSAAKRPVDHVFSYLEGQGVSMVAPSVSTDEVDATHRILKWGCSYIQPDPPLGPWSFNGTGQLCQMRFSIVGQVNATHPKWSTLLTFDTSWTSLYQQPTPTKIVPPFENARVTYLYPVAPKATALSISPASVVDPTLLPSHSFTVNLTVVNATDLYRWQAIIYFSNQILNATDVEEGSFLPTVGTTTFQSSTNLAYNATHGRITLAENLTGAAGAYGDGQLAAITFHVLDNGSTPITISNDTLYDSGGSQIAHTTSNGYFSNLPVVVIVDVAVTKVETDRTLACAGMLVRINVTVSNEGGAAETFDVKVYYDTNLIDTKTVTALDPGGNRTVTAVWNTTNVPTCQNHTISAEIPALPQETNVANNKLTDGTVKITIMGDIDGNGSVDMGDIMTVLNAFGTYPGHARWNPVADLYQDNQIDLTDIIFVLMNIGKKC
jgi:hypothetical protein